MTELGRQQNNFSSNVLQELVLQPEKPFNYPEILIIFALSVVLAVGTVGNVLVIYAFKWGRSRGKTRRNFESLLATLAVIDLFASVTVPTLFLYGTITRYKAWHFGYAGCKIILSIFPMTTTLSLGILMLIAYERYHGIKNPLAEPLRRSSQACWLILASVTAIALVSPYTYALKIVSNTLYGMNTCTTSDLDEVFVYAIGKLSRDIFATSVMFILGIRSVITLKAKSKHLEQMSYKHRTLRKKNSNKAQNMFMVVVAVFTVCVLPLDIYQVVVYSLYKIQFPFSKDSFETILQFNTILTVLQVANSATNVIIYSGMNRSFKQRLKFKTRNLFQTIVRIRRSNQVEREPFVWKSSSTRIKCKQTNELDQLKISIK